MKLDKLINSNGLFLGARWKMSQTSDYFFLQDLLGGGYYRFSSIDRTLEVDTLQILAL